MIEREMAPRLQEMAEKFPVVYLSGPRQSGKTTLARAAFPEYGYVSFENPDVRRAFEADPNTFLAHYGCRTVFDEAQRVPELFSYLQGIVDEDGGPGQYVLTGSQNFLLMQSISQTLAGRVSIFTLPPLSLHELCQAGLAPASIEEWLFMGGYPRLYDAGIEPPDFFPGYLRTYIERDVRGELGVRSLHDFDTFVRLCAIRTGELLNLTSLASDCGINRRTAQSWLSILEASGIVYLLQPHFSNAGKRLVKSPKLYLVDTGLACSLIGLDAADELTLDERKGHLFESAVIAEALKRSYAQGREPRLSFWRDANGREIDLLVEKGLKPVRAVEIKASATYNPKFFDALDRVAGPELGLDSEACSVVYGGDMSFTTEHGSVVAFRDLQF